MSKEVEVIARRLDWLLRNHPKPDGALYTYREIEAISDEHGYPIDAATIGRLRHGQLQQPGLLKVRALARVFQLPDSRLLYDEDEYSDRDLEVASRATSLAHDGVQEIAFRAATALNDQQREIILQIIRLMARTEAAEDNE